jgi:diketogulonate reductase-like aldo/keto reductase
MRHPNVIAIPKASDPAHVRENAASSAIELSPDDLSLIDSVHPPPTVIRRMGTRIWRMWRAPVRAVLQRGSR